MAVGKILVRSCTVHVNTGTDATPVWTQVKGLTEPVEHSPSTSRTDTTDCDSAGREEHLVVSRSDQFTLKGFRMEDASNGTRDAGQSAVEAVADLMGDAGLKGYKLTSPGGKTYIFKASSQVKYFGGGIGDAVPWECELQVSGLITKA